MVRPSRHNVCCLWVTALLLLQAGTGAGPLWASDVSDAPERPQATLPREESPPRFELNVAPEQIELGAEVLYRVVFTAPEDYRFYFPSPPALQPFVLVPGSLVTRREPGEGPDLGLVNTVVELRLRSYRLGVRWIPAVEVAFLGPEGETGVVDLPRRRVEVVARVAVDDLPALANPPPPRSVIATNWTLVWGAVILGSVLGAVVLTVLALWLFGGRLMRPPPPPPPRPPHETALIKLAQIERERLPESGALMDYYVRVSEAVREYLGARYRVDGLMMTTGELLRSLESADLRGVPHSRVRAFLEECDLVKFANFAPSPEEIEWLLATAYGLVRDTMQVVTPEEQEAARPQAADHPARPSARAFAWSLDLASFALPAGGLLVLGRLIEAESVFVAAAVLLVLLGLLLRDLPSAGSLGKAITGLRLAGYRPPAQDPKTRRLVPQEGRLPGGGARVRRNLAQLVPFVGQAVEFVVLAHDPDSRRLGDRLAGTAVLDIRAVERKRGGEVGLLLGAMVTTLLALAALVMPLVAL